MRIAVAGFMHESNTFNETPTDRRAFESQTLRFGGDWVPEWRDAHHEVGGFLEGVQKLGAEVVPIGMAWATPAGPVADEVFEEIAREYSDRLKREKPDGLLLSVHGAMVAKGHPDGDGDFVARIRKAVGPDLPIVVTLDLHGNISSQLVENCNAAISYRTNPHVDQRARGLQAAELMGRMLKKELKPVQALSKPPAMVNIMVQDSSVPPMSLIEAECRKTEEKPGILAVSFLPGFAYSDVPQMGPSIIVVADGDRDLAQREADRLGRMIFDMREQLNRPLPGPAEAVARAIQSTETPVVLVDTGDNVGGGSAADSTILLAEMLKQGATDGVVCLFAPEEARLCAEAGIGAEVRITVGGKVDRRHGDPVPVVGRVRVLHDGTYLEAQVRHGGKRLNHMGLTALVEIEGRNLIVLNELRHPPFSLGQLTCLGVQPGLQKILVVKAAIAYKAAYRPVAGSIIEVDTPGTSAVNPRRFEYKHIRPMYPLKADVAF